MKNAVAYYRVSTDRQGKSGLGLQAQHQSVHLFSQLEGYQVIAEFVEIESAKKNHRPKLMAALLQCKKQKATLIIAKLDRLGRNVAFIANLMESKAEFRAVDNPHANPLMVHMLAAFAQHERELISTRTKEALQAAKRRGIKLGKHGREVESKKNLAAANQFAESMRPIIDELKAEGFESVRGICEELNQRGVKTFRNDGQQWHRTTVHRLIKRLNIN
ncbi:recombinase family protein [Dyadobacter fanqingshengii]|uniref:recombinase family protein n=1 Tax=Dyadobacter fanqingshengii TaxID=2906443 RepID=UPI0020C18DD4|nr:recombinase family protein [Dyadobacter fanqingshengii]UTM21865.1 recombinase family protein [Dyadobacter fanqingshengii]